MIDELSFQTVLILAVMVEAIIENIKWVVEKGFNWERVAALVVGVVVSLSTGLDLFALVGIPMTVPLLGPALTGILIARGAQVAHDLYRSVTSVGSVLSYFRKGGVQTLGVAETATDPAQQSPTYSL